MRYAMDRQHHYQLIFGDAPISDPSPEIEAAADDGMAALVELVERAQDEGELAAGPPRGRSPRSCGRSCTVWRNSRSPGTCGSPGPSRAMPVSSSS